MTEQWFDMCVDSIKYTEKTTIVCDEEGETMFTLPWHASRLHVNAVKQIADRAYRCGKAVGGNQKINEIRQVLDLAARAFNAGDL